MAGDIHNNMQINLSFPAVVWIISLIISIVNALGVKGIPWITPIAWIITILGFIYWILYLFNN